MDASSQPFPDFVVPVAHQARGRHHDGLVYLWFTIWALAQQGPHECDALQSLAQAHFICHNAAVGVGDSSPRHTVPKKLHTLTDKAIEYVVRIKMCVQSVWMS